MADDAPGASPADLSVRTGEASLLVEELDPCHHPPVIRSTGRRLRRHVLPLPDGLIENTSVAEGRAAFALPGLPAA
ncbi:hypothetical protein [Streptomyces sp. NPDC002287]